MLTLSVLVSTPTAVAAEGSCAENSALSAPASLTLRGHTYTLIGACSGLPVYRTARTDSTFLDRAAADRAVILVTAESVDPTAAEDGWPAPTGNLYFSYPFPAPPEQARQHLSAAIAEWWALQVPEVVATEGWEGSYGAHRAADGRFLTGLALDAPGAGRVPVGVDIHLNATPAQYAVLGADEDHVSLATLTGQRFDVDAVLWAILSRLDARADVEVE